MNKIGNGAVKVPGSLSLPSYNPGFDSLLRLSRGQGTVIHPKRKSRLFTAALAMGNGGKRWN